MAPPRLVLVVDPKFAHIAALPVTVRVNERGNQDRRVRKEFREHGKRAAQRRGRHLVLYPQVVVVEGGE